MAWEPVLDFAQAWAARLGHELFDPTATRLPTPGTPAWCGLADGDIRKLLSLVARGTKAALADDLRQAAVCAASQALSAATFPDDGVGDKDSRPITKPWRSLAQRTVRGRGPAFIPRHREASS